MLKRAARKMLPGRAYGIGRRLVHNYKNYKHQRLPKLSEAEFRHILTDTLGVRAGAVVFVHSSMGQINLGFSFHRVLAVLVEAVGEGGTVLFPCSHLSERPEDWLKKGEVFDVKKNPTTMGIIPEFARRQKGASRSAHPTSSVVAIGKCARELTRDHSKSIYPCGERSPYYKIVHHDGLIVGLGVNTEVLTFVHCLEDNWKERFPVETRSRETFAARVRDEDECEQIVQTLVAQKRIRWRHIPRYMQRHVPVDVCRDLKIGGVNFYTARSKDLYAKMEELASRDITIYSRLVHRKSPFSQLLNTVGG